jgi:LAO/AO transport system kinase
MLTLGGAEERRRRWVPPIIETIAINGTGVDKVWDACQRHRLVLNADERMGRSRDRLREEVLEAVTLGVGAYVNEALSRNGAMEDILAAVLRRELDPKSAADQIIERHLRRLS